MDRELKESVKLILNKAKDVKMREGRKGDAHNCEECVEEQSVNLKCRRKSKLQLIFGKRVSKIFLQQIVYTKREIIQTERPLIRKN